MSNRPLSLNDFKNWLSEQKGMPEFFSLDRSSEDSDEKYVGKEVRSKVSEAKLLERIKTEDDPVQLVQEFLDNGGTALGIEGKFINIEVESGEFTLPRFCVRIRKE